MKWNCWDLNFEPNDGIRMGHMNLPYTLVPYLQQKGHKLLALFRSEKLGRV